MDEFVKFGDSPQVYYNNQKIDEPTYKSLTGQSGPVTDFSNIKLLGSATPSLYTNAPVYQAGNSSNTTLGNITTPSSVPATILGNVSGFDLAQFIKNHQSKQDTLLNSINSYFTPTAEESTAQKSVNDIQTQIDNTNLGAEAGINDASQQVVPMRFITGQQSKIAKDANLKLQTLSAQQNAALRTLQSAQATRQQKLDSAKYLLDASRQDLQTTLDMYKQLSPENLGTQVLDNGNLMVITRNPLTGEVTTKTVGNVKVTSPFYKFDNDSTVYTRDGKALTSAADYVAAGGRGDWTDVQTVKVTNPDEEKMVQQMAITYPDAGITLNDSLESAQAKLSSSRIYQDQVRGPVGGDGGLSPAQINSTVNSIASSFDNEPIVKNFNTANEAYQTLQTIGVNTNSPADDIAFIYAFAKIMDPNSVVREGEYNTVQKYAQTWADNFGFTAKRIFSNTNFLTPDAKQKMLNALSPKINTLQNQYTQVRSEYQRQIDDAMQGKPRTITDYSIPAATSEPSAVTNNNQTNNQPEQPKQEKGFWSSVGNWLWGGN